MEEELDDISTAKVCGVFATLGLCCACINNPPSPPRQNWLQLGTLCPIGYRYSSKRYFFQSEKEISATSIWEKENSDSTDVGESATVPPLADADPKR